MYGFIKWFGGYNRKHQRANHFGFIEAASGDVYFHQDTVQEFTHVSDDLSEGQLVELDFVRSAKGLSAEHVRVIKDLSSLQDAKLNELLNCGLSLSKEMTLRIKELIQDRVGSLGDLAPKIDQWISESTTSNNVLGFSSSTKNYRSLYREIPRSSPTFESPELDHISWEPQKTFKCAALSRLLEGAEASKLLSFLESYGHVLSFDDLNRSIRAYMDVAQEPSLKLFVKFFRRLDDQMLEQFASETYKKLPLRQNDVSSGEFLSLLKTLRSMSPLYHMTEKNNLSSIMKHGLLSHTEAHRKGLVKRDVSQAEVQSRRTNLHNHVPLYFNPRNAMLFSFKDLPYDIVMIAINPLILLMSDLVTDGNAASDGTSTYKITSLSRLKQVLQSLEWSRIMTDSWNHEDRSVKVERRRKISAEALVLNQIPLHMIEYVGAQSEQTLSEIEGQCSPQKITALRAPHLYFDSESSWTRTYSRRRWF